MNFRFAGKQRADQEEVHGFNRAVEVLQLVAEVFCLQIQICIAIIQAIYTFFMPPEPKDVHGDIVLITGSGHGMGREMALRFAKLRATVICVDVDPQGNEETVNMIKQLKGKVFGYECDVTNREAVMKLAEKVRKDVGDVTILVNNAGIMPCRSILEHTEREIRLVNDINVNGNLWMIQAFLPAMMRKNYGHIVAMGSMASLMGTKNLVPYTGSKFAVRGIMQALEVELRQSDEDYSGINLTTVCPYIVNTGLCHKPKIRFAKIMKPVEATDAADQILNAVRRNYTEVTIPSYYWYIYLKLGALFPVKVVGLCQDFSKTGVDAHNPNQF